MTSLGEPSLFQGRSTASRPIWASFLSPTDSTFGVMGFQVTLGSTLSLLLSHESLVISKAVR